MNFKFSNNAYLDPIKKTRVPNAPKIVSLFCGAGGLDIGFLQAGFRVALALDYFPAAIKTHKSNGLSDEAFCLDIKKLGSAGVSAKISEAGLEEDPIGIIGGPPCQGFSRANSASSASDPRNYLVRSYVNAISYLNKRRNVSFVVFENVLGIRDSKHSEAYRHVTKSLSRMGFKVHELELLATDFGVPQMRRRVVIVAEKYGVSFDDEVRDSYSGNVVVRDVLGGLPEPVFFSRDISPGDIPFHPNHWTMRPKSKRFEVPIELWEKSRSFKLLEWDKPSPTIAFGNREIHVHPSGKRRISILEAMRIQGFPDEFSISGNLSEQVLQISNAVPPPMARYIALKILEKIKGKVNDCAA